MERKGRKSAYETWKADEACAGVFWQVFWRRRTCLERFLLVVCACLVVVVVILLALVASRRHDVPPEHHQSQLAGPGRARHSFSAPPSHFCTILQHHISGYIQSYHVCSIKMKEYLTFSWRFVSVDNKFCFTFFCSITI